MKDIYSVESESSMYLLEYVDEGGSDKMKWCEGSLC